MIAISKGMLAVKFCYNEIFQVSKCRYRLTHVDLYIGCEMVVFFCCTWPASGNSRKECQLAKLEVLVTVGYMIYVNRQ